MSSAAPTLPGLPLEPLSGSAVTLGNFDGVHLGHRAILDQVSSSARNLGVVSVVITFHPHPVRLLRPEAGLRMITPIVARVRALRERGIDRVVVLPFDRDLAALDAESFLRRCVLDPLRPRVFVVGPDTRFGRGARGDAELLRKVGGRKGFDVVDVAPVRVDGARISSTGLRRLLAEGRVHAAAAWLGRPFSIEGSVVHGEGRGRLLRFPTANVASAWEIRPAQGVYAVRMRLLSSPGEDPAPWRPGVANLGLRPTFKKGAAGKEGAAGEKAVLEVHLIDGDPGEGAGRHGLYGRKVEVAFVRRLREERRFPSADALRAQIARDIGHAREVLE